MNNRFSFLNSVPQVTKNIIFINIFFVVANWILYATFIRLGYEGLNDFLGMHYFQSSKFNPVQLITYAFMHAGFFHLLFNMLGLYMFGAILEHVWGPKRFLTYYVFTAVGAAIVQQLFWYIDIQHALQAINEQLAVNSTGAGLTIEQQADFFNQFVTVGASGAVMGIMLAFGWLFPEQIIYVYFIPVKARTAVVIFTVLELFLGVAQFTGDQIAHYAHLGGMLFGAILILFWKKWKK